MTNRASFHFQPVDEKHRSLVHDWLRQPHVAEWFYGEGLETTIHQLDAFLHSSSIFQYWLAFDGEHPFALFMTSPVKKPDDPLAQWCSKEGEAITLDMLIGDMQYLGKRLSHILIQEFLLLQFSLPSEVLIDPDVANLRAVRAYQKAGFVIVGEYVPSHSPKPHYMMRLDMQKLHTRTT